MKCCLIGIGRFGTQLATTLAEHDIEVLAIDKDPMVIDRIKDTVSHAITIHAYDENSLRAAGVDEFSIVIIALGKNFADAVTITRICKQSFNTSRVIVRSGDRLQKEILKLIGADLVILPELESAARLADMLTSGFADATHIDAHIAVVRMNAPAMAIDQAIQDIALLKKHAVNCIAIHRNGSTFVAMPETIIEREDVLFLIGNDQDLSRCATVFK